MVFDRNRKLWLEIDWIPASNYKTEPVFFIYIYNDEVWSLYSKMFVKTSDSPIAGFNKWLLAEEGNTSTPVCAENWDMYVFTTSSHPPLASWRSSNGDITVCVEFWLWRNQIVPSIKASVKSHLEKLKSQTHTQPEPGQYYCMLYIVFYLALVIFDFILASLW